VLNPHGLSLGRLLFLILLSEHSLIGSLGVIFGTHTCIIIVLLNLLILFSMREIGKYYMFVSSGELFFRRSKANWFQFFRVGSFVRVLFYSEAYINLKFTGICTKKSFHGLASTFTLVNKIGLKYKYFAYMPTILRLVLVRF
jgi:hypothetical protein